MIYHLYRYVLKMRQKILFLKLVGEEQLGCKKHKRGMSRLIEPLIILELSVSVSVFLTHYSLVVHWNFTNNFTTTIELKKPYHEIFDISLFIVNPLHLGPWYTVS